MTQVVAYADDIVVVCRSLQSTRMAFEAIEVQAKMKANTLLKRNPIGYINRLNKTK